MGLSIHYNGYLKEAKSLPDLILEVKEVAEIHGWKYKIFNTKFPDEQFNKEPALDKFYGIYFIPVKSEPILLVFLSNGRMVNPMGVKISNPSELEQKDSWIYNHSVKTQYAGVAVHQLIIKFFRYLNDKYFRDFEMMDESYYWETNDEEKMKERFREYNAVMDNFKLTLETFPLENDEDVTKYFERLMKHINNLKNDN